MNVGERAITLVLVNAPSASAMTAMTTLSHSNATPLKRHKHSCLVGGAIEGQLNVVVAVEEDGVLVLVSFERTMHVRIRG